MYLLPYGIIIGISIGVIPGPIAILCIRRSMVDGFFMGVATGFGASLAHFIFGSIAAFGLTSIKNTFIAQGIWLRLVGSSYLLYLAFKAATRNISLEQEHQTMSHQQAILSTFLLNMTNPIVITSYAAFLSMFNVSIISIAGGIQLLVGIFLGNFGWWIILSGISKFLGSFSNNKVLTWINNGAAVLIAAFGIIGLSTTIYTIFQ